MSVPSSPDNLDDKARQVFNQTEELIARTEYARQQTIKDARIKVANYLATVMPMLQSSLIKKVMRGVVQLAVKNGQFNNIGKILQIGWVSYDDSSQVRSNRHRKPRPTLFSYQTLNIDENYYINIILLGNSGTPGGLWLGENQHDGSLKLFLSSPSQQSYVASIRTEWWYSPPSGIAKGRIPAKEQQQLLLLTNQYQPHGSKPWKVAFTQGKTGLFTILYVKDVDIDDFVANPQLFTEFRHNVEEILGAAAQKAQEQLAAIEQRRKLFGLDTILYDATAEARKSAESGDMSEIDIQQAARGLAEAAVVLHPTLKAAISDAEQRGIPLPQAKEQITKIVSTAVEERIGKIQDESRKALSTTVQNDQNSKIIIDASPDPGIQKEITQIAAGDVQVEKELQQVSQGYRNPQRVLGAILKIIGTIIPGARMVIAILEAANDLFGATNAD